MEVQLSALIKRFLILSLLITNCLNHNSLIVAFYWKEMCLFIEFICFIVFVVGQYVVYLFICSSQIFKVNIKVYTIDFEKKEYLYKIFLIQVCSWNNFVLSSRRFLTFYWMQFLLICLLCSWEDGAFLVNGSKRKPTLSHFLFSQTGQS